MLLISCWQSGRVIIEKCTRGGKKVNIYLQVSLLISTFVVIQNYTYSHMNAKRLLLLTAVCLTIGVTEAPAQGFLNKLKKKGMKIIKDAVPNPVKDVTDAASNPERVVNRAKNCVTGGHASQSGDSRRSRAQATNRAATGQRREVKPAKKQITIKLYRGLGPSTWEGRKTQHTPKPPMQCPKQPAWFSSLPFPQEMDNATLAEEYAMINNWVQDGKPSCEPVLVRREQINDEISARHHALDKAVEYLLSDHENEDGYYEAAEPLEDDFFKHAMQSDLAPLYPGLNEKTVEYFKSIDRKTKEITVRVYEGNSAYDNKMHIGEMWFNLNFSDRTATLERIDNDESVGKDYTVPSTVRYAGCVFRVTEIGASAFQGMKMRSVTLSPGLKTIGTHAFYETSISEINIPPTVTKIDSHAFGANAALKRIVLPNSVKTIGRGVFSGCTGLTEAVLPNRVETMENTVFWGCKSLTSVTLPQNLTELEEATFRDCTSLTHVDLPQSVAVIKENAFCNTAMTSVPLTESLKEIRSGAFEDCNRLTSVSLPSRVALDMWAFKNCKSLRKAAIGVQYKDIPDDVYMMFIGCPFAQKPLTKMPACVTFNE